MRVVIPKLRNRRAILRSSLINLDMGGIMTEPDNQILALRRKQSALPFIRMNACPGCEVERDYWSPSSTGDYSSDCTLGRDYAKSMIDHLGRHSDDVPLAMNIIRSVGQVTEPTGVEIGFLTQVVCSLRPQC